MGFFATPATVKTTGTRGKSTKRRGTKSVRGAEGAWIAQAKNELCEAAPTLAWEVMIVRTSPAGYRFAGKYPPEHTVENDRCVIVDAWCEKTETEALKRAEWYMAQGWVAEYWSDWTWEVRVRLVGRIWRMVNGKLVQVVCEYHS